MNNKKIFVQIAAYRDPELIPTIKDCIDKAKWPKKLVFSIAWQHSIEDVWDNLDEFKSDERFKIIDIDYTQAKGPCWARNALQQQYDDEEYTLQLDSHTRFSQDWDEKLIMMYKDLQAKGHQKPLITSYACSYEPNNDPGGRIHVPWKMNFDRFGPEGNVHFLPSSIDEFKELDSPIPGRFYSAHYAFTTGDFVKEVPHDPEYYFHGEEISIAVRAYTWGYDLFHPHKVIIWHEYTRNDKRKQWDDDKVWGERDASSHKKNRELFFVDGEERTRDFGIYDFGKVRSLRSYEEYSGINFTTRGVQQHTLDHKNPPNPIIHSHKEYENSFVYFFKHCIDLYAANFKEEDYDFWVVSFEKEDGTVISRLDADENEVKSLIAASKSDGWIRLWRSYFGQKPDLWVVWPHSKSKGWLERVTESLKK